MTFKFVYDNIIILDLIRSPCVQAETAKDVSASTSSVVAAGSAGCGTSLRTSTPTVSLRASARGARFAAVSLLAD